MHPTWAWIAHDYLPIQGSAIPCEHRFSSSALTGSDHCNCLLPYTFECLQLLKDGYHSGAVSAKALNEIEKWYEWDADADNEDVDEDDSNVEDFD